MSERTYRFGYGSLRLTATQLMSKWTWAKLHPEMRRRVMAMMDASMDAGYDCGVGEGARSTVQQAATFYERHNPVVSGGCCSYQGKRYQLKPGKAPIAPPGSSVHEDQLYEGYALAVDLVGWENHWFDANCMRFGLKNFGGAIGPDVNNEEWHFQPLEFANARSAIVDEIKAGKRLRVFPLPGDQLPPPVITPPTPEPPVVPTPQPSQPILEEDTMVVLVITDVRPPYARWKSDGVVKTWITGDMSAQVDARLAECANGTQPSPVDGFVYRELRHGGNDVIASYGPIVGPHPGAPFDGHGRIV